MTKKQQLDLVIRSRPSWLVKDTVLDMLVGWLRRRGIVSERTIAEYSKHIRQYFKKQDVARDANPYYRLDDYLKEYAEAVGKGRLTASSYNVRLAAVKNVAVMMLEYAHRMGKKNVDPAALVSWKEQWLDVNKMQPIRGKRGVRAGRWLSKEEVEKMLGCVNRETLEGKRDLVLMGMAFGVGLRRFELSGLKVGQVKGSWAKGRCMVVGLKRKGSKVSDVPVPRWVWDCVEDWRRTAGLADDDWLICEVRGGKVVKGKGLSGEGIRKRLGVLSKKSGLEGRVRPHDARRTCAGLIVELSQGGGLRQAQQQLGHASIRTTEKYVAAGLELREGMAAVDRLGLSVPSKEVRGKLERELEKEGMKVLGEKTVDGVRVKEWGRRKRRRIGGKGSRGMDIIEEILAIRKAKAMRKARRR